MSQENRNETELFKSFLSGLIIFLLTAYGLGFLIVMFWTNINYMSFVWGLIQSTIPIERFILLNTIILHFTCGVFLGFTTFFSFFYLIDCLDKLIEYD